MRLELSELFVCPRCRPAQGLVVLVDALESGHRVRSGHLGCPACEARFPIREGTLRFGRAAPVPGDAVDPERAATESAPAEAPDTGFATEAAALSGIREGGGVVLLDPRLEPLARRISELTGGAEVLALAGGAGRSREGVTEGVTRAAGVDPSDLPLFPGRVDAAVLLGERGGLVGEWVRVLREGGRFVALRPSADVREAAAEEPLEVLAREERALVAVRRRADATERADASG